MEPSGLTIHNIVFAQSRAPVCSRFDLPFVLVAACFSGCLQFTLHSHTIKKAAKKSQNKEPSEEISSKQPLETNDRNEPKQEFTVKRIVVTS
jgi:hypothetical protein